MNRFSIQLTPGNLNLPLTWSEWFFPSGHFLYNFTLDNSNSQQLEPFVISQAHSQYWGNTFPLLSKT